MLYQWFFFFNYVSGIIFQHAFKSGVNSTYGLGFSEGNPYVQFQGLLYSKTQFQQLYIWESRWGASHTTDSTEI